MLQRISGIALARLGQLGEAETELVSALEASRERGSDYDIAATIDVLGTLGMAEPRLSRERGEILRRLMIEKLPTPLLPSSVAESKVAIR